ncbi:MAG: putative integral membrane protein (TIGR00697 family) [Kiritimatiellia bacterium]|jgi:uncharacterized integral membrane protein (TIGR00697 family)
MSTVSADAQHRWEGYDLLPDDVVQRRRQRVFLICSGLFLGTLAMLNILGISRFIDLSFTVPGIGLIPMPLAVGVLPYPVTFLCTDFICELYGKRRANDVVVMGLILNIWVVFILWLGGVLPGPEWEGPDAVFFTIRDLTFGGVAASMVAYLVAQFVDVNLFHFWKKLTKGKHLWLRNNGSTLVSQIVDSAAVILITHFYAGLLPINPDEGLWGQLLTYIAAGYIFKMACALLDTGPFYLGVYWLRRYLRLAPATG